MEMRKIKMERGSVSVQNFSQITEDILRHPQFQALRYSTHHGPENSLYDHSVDTARCAYRMARRFHLREERVAAVTRAALLHDFFCYDWRGPAYRRFVQQYSGLQRLRHMHAFVHGPRAARRAGRLFPMDARQCAAISSHMFPLAGLPRNSEAWILTLADKIVASREMSAALAYHMRRWYHRMAPAR